MHADADVVVVGAGPTGTALALLLGRAGLRTVVLDRARFPRDKPCGEGLMPAGAAVLEELGVSLDRFPALAGVTYRTPAGARVDGSFATGRPGRGVRRLVFDALLVDAAAACSNVDVRLDTRLEAVDIAGDRIAAGTTRGRVTARYLVGADGQRSTVARLMGWARPSRTDRHAVVGHVEAPRHGVDRVVVTLLEAGELYLAPVTPDLLLAAALGGRGALHSNGAGVRESYRALLADARLGLDLGSSSRLFGASSFWTRPARVAEGRVFLAGDAAGFLDPLTGDGITAGILAAQRLGRLLAGDERNPASAFAGWHARCWRRRLLLARLALGLTGSALPARLAFRGLQRRPVTLDRLLQVNDGTRGVASLSPRDWAALVGV